MVLSAAAARESLCGGLALVSGVAVVVREYLCGGCPVSLWYGSACMTVQHVVRRDHRGTSAPV